MDNLKNRCQCGGPMNSELARTPNPVEQARNLLRVIFKYEQARDPRGTDTGSLERMLGHLHNIEKSVTTSMQDHVNASKRLRDFAETLERMKERLVAGPHQDQANQISNLITVLRKASSELGVSGAPPAWASSEPRKPLS
jgi:hypothetical protein